MKYFLSYLFLFLAPWLYGQAVQWELLAPMPEPVSNNAVAMAMVEGVPHVYSFAGIDTSRDWYGIHLKGFRYNTQTEVWDTIPPLPAPMGGKIATSASVVKNKIYIIGGYHVASNYNESSSNKVHIYDPEANAYLPDGMAIPFPIDDQVQMVWRDSLIFVVTGWSNTNNVANVQIYDPAADSWMAGTPVPNNNNWKVFGGSGVIVGDTIYYAGGARFGSNFPATSYFRKGFINPDNPMEINWEGFETPAAQGYRMAAGVLDGKPFWLGGSDVTYNFDGIAYNGSGSVSPQGRLTFYDPASGALGQLEGQIPATMDFRGLAQIGPNQFILAGGMQAGPEVSGQVLLVTIAKLTGSTDEPSDPKAPPLFVFPNPTFNQLQVNYPHTAQLDILNSAGQVVLQSTIQGPSQVVDISQLRAGLYFVLLRLEGQLIGWEKIYIYR